MFPKKERLARTVAPNGRRFSSKNFTIILPTDSVGYAIVIPKKVARLSVTRHGIKRRVSSALRTIKLPPALIIFPRLPVSSVSYQDMKIELATLLSKTYNQ